MYVAYYIYEYTLHCPKQKRRKQKRYEEHRFRATDHTHCTQTATHCNSLKHTAAPCITLHSQHDATHCNTATHCTDTATYCNTLYHTVPHCNTLQHTLQHTASRKHTANKRYAEQTFSATDAWTKQKIQLKWKKMEVLCRCQLTTCWAPILWPVSSC